MKPGTVVVAIILAAILIFGGLSLQKSHATSTVKESLQTQFDADEKYKEYQLKVGEVRLIRKSLFSFDGLASVNMDGENHNVRLDVTMDGMSIYWETQPFALGFLAKKDLEKLQRDLEKDLEGALTPSPVEQLSPMEQLLADNPILSLIYRPEYPEVPSLDADAAPPEESEPPIVDSARPMTSDEISDVFSKY